MTTTINADNGVSSGSAGLKESADSSGVLQLQTNGTAALTIDTSQNVGIGTVSPSTKIDIVGATGIRTRYDSSGAGVVLSQPVASGGDAYLTNQANSAIYFGTNNTAQVAITNSGLLQFNSGYGSVATAYGCRAWVNFNGVTTVTIRASGNVTSVTRNAAGDYTVNFTNAMPDANYTVSGIAKYNSTATNAWRLLALYSNAAYSSVVTTTSVRVQTMYANGTASEDTEAGMVLIHR